MSGAEVDGRLRLCSRCMATVKEARPPGEVKAGKTGSLRSLQVFMQKKKTPLAVRFNLERPLLSDVATSVPGPKHRFRLVSLPLYMVEQWKRFVTHSS